LRHATRMAGISPATIERIRAASDIVDVIGAALPLKKAGVNFTALCPFHKEKTPSFNVNPHRQIFHCFGCQKGGDVFTFVKEYENIGFVDAVRRLAERAKIPLEFDNNPAAQESRHIKEQLIEIHEKITQRWQNCLLNEAAGKTTRDYLAKRGVSAEAIKLFRLGAAPELWDDTVNWAKSKNYELPLVEKAGLIIRNEETGNYYDRFRGRLMFPICDEQGRVIGFSGRVLSGDEKVAKYVNSPETPIFTKGKVFFGLDKAKRAILDAEEAIICEGQIDLIACHMAGVNNVVAPQGTALTVDHARILQRYTDLIVLCFDADQAGWKAAIKAFDPQIAAKISVLVAIVPAPHDPDSFIKTFGSDAFRKLISDAQSFFDFYLNYLCANNNAATDQGRIVIVNSMIEALQKTGNAVQIDKYIQKTALRLGVSSEAVRKEFSKFKVQGSESRIQEPEQTLNPEPETLNPPSPHEFHLLKLLLLHDDLVPWTALHLDANWILHPLARQIISQRLAAQGNETWKNLAVFLDGCNSDEMRNLVTEAVAEERKIPNPEMQLADVALKLRNQFFDRQITALTQKASQPEISESERLELLHEQQKLRQQKRAPLAQLTN
jgi:DNA primase